MTKNKILFWIFVALAMVATALSICFLFLGTKSINDTPSKLNVTMVDGEHYITAQYQGDYWYQFKLEQKIDDEYVLINQVNSEINSIKLDENLIDVLPGKEYRFSARYIAENGGGRGKFCDYYYWKPVLVLGKVENISYDNATETLSWKEIYNADYYSIRFVDGNGNVAREITTLDSFVSLADRVKVGSYDVYVVAMSSTQNLESSDSGSGVKIDIIRKNEICSVSFKTNLVVETSEKVESFEIYSGDVLKATIVANNVEMHGNLYKYTFGNVGGYITGLKNLKIKSLACEFVLESDLETIVLA